MQRIVIQGLLLLPAFTAVGALPMLLLSVLELLLERNWRGAVFNGLALPGFLALVASVALPQRWLSRPGARWTLVAGLVMAGAACLTLALIMLVGAGGRLRPPSSAVQSALIGGPLIVVVWNLWRLTGRPFAILASACGVFVFLGCLWMTTGAFNGCTRDYDAATGEHTVCR